MRLFVVVLTVSMISLPCYAYIDAGTGSMIVQALVAMLMLLPLYFGKVVGAIKNLFKKFLGKGKK